MSIRRAMILVVLGVGITACSADQPRTSDPTPTAGGDLSPTASESAVDESATVDDPDRSPVIVDLAVDWRPEGELSDDDRVEQRRRIEAAADEIITALGDHGEVHRRLTMTAQLSLSVDDDGLAILERHRLVATIHDDTTSAPTG